LLLSGKWQISFHCTVEREAQDALFCFHDGSAKLNMHICY